MIKLNISTKLISYFVLIWNLIFVIGGLSLLVIGILKKKQIDTGLVKVNRLLDVAPTIAIPIGILIFIIAFLGCWGAYKKKNWMLITYAVIVLMILFVQLIIAFTAFNVLLNYDAIRVVINDDIEDNFLGYGGDKAMTKKVDDFQHEFQCCGVEGPKYWNGTSMPPSCCKGNSKPCKEPFKIGCVDRIFRAVKAALIMLGVFATVFLIAEAIVAGGALYLRHQITKEESVQV